MKIIAVAGGISRTIGGENDRVVGVTKQTASECLSIYDPADTYFIIGMQNGFELAVAEECIDKGFQFTAALSYSAQDERWIMKSRARYAAALSKATKVVEVSTGEYRPHLTKMKYRWMLQPLQGASLLLTLSGKLTDTTIDLYALAEYFNMEVYDARYIFAEYRDKMKLRHNKEKKYWDVTNTASKP